MRTTTIRAAVAAGVLLLAGACTDDDPAPVDPTPSWSPTGTIDRPSPSSSAEPVEPALPDAAREASEAGARAFIGYYWELVNYAQVTGDVKALRKASGKTCEGCKAGMKGIRQLYEDGGHIEGGAYSVRLRKVDQLGSGDPSRLEFEAEMTVTTDEQQVFAGDGTTTTNPAATSTLVVAVSWLDSYWLLERMTVS